MPNLIAGWGSGWDERTAVENQTYSGPHRKGVERDHSVRSEWSSSSLGVESRIRNTWRIVWYEVLTADTSRTFPWGKGDPIGPTQIVPAWDGIMEYIDLAVRAPWGPYPNQVQVGLAGEWSKPEEFDDRYRVPWGTFFPGPQVGTAAVWSTPDVAQGRKEIPWGWGVKNNYRPPWLDVNLPPPDPGTAQRIVPDLVVYYQMNIATVSRLPELTPLDFKSLRISVDVDSFAARWSGTLSAASYELIKPVGATRHQIKATINGYVWHLIVEKPGHKLSFGRGDYQVSGRAHVAELADPQSPTRDFVSTAQKDIRQLVDDELTNTGWTANWSTEFWLIPAGAFAYESLSPIQAVARLASAAGAVVQADESLKELAIKPRFPLSPWNWAAATPDWSIPMAAVYTLASDWSEKPMYNAVIVSGENQGVVCNVTRQGSAGDVLAPTVVDPLITHQDAARERARNIISDRGVQSVETLELPLRANPDEPGYIRPLELIQYTDAAGSWKGLCIGSEVRVEWGRGSMTIKQTIKVERHHDE